MPKVRVGGIKVLSVMVPFSLEDPTSISAAIQAADKLNVPVSFSTVFSKTTPETIAALRNILQRGRPVDIEVQTNMTDNSLEGFEEFLTKATVELEAVPPIILCE